MAKTKRRYIPRVTADLQEGVDIELGPRTLIIGDNADGKDAIVRAVTLATRGAVDDFEGSDDVRATHKLSAFAPGRRGLLQSRVLDSNGDVGSFSLTVNPDGSTSDKSDKGALLPKVYSPVIDLTTQLRASVETRRKWLLDLIGDDITEEHVLEAIPGPFRGDYMALQSAVRASAGRRAAEEMSAAAMLVRCQAEAKSRKAGARSTRKAAAALAAQLGKQHQQSIPTATEVEAAKTEAEQARALVAQSRAASGGATMGAVGAMDASSPVSSAPDRPGAVVTDAEINALPQWRASLESLSTQVHEANTNVAHIEGSVASMPSPPDNHDTWATETRAKWSALKRAAKTQIDAAMNREITDCQFCGQVLDAEAMQHAQTVLSTADQWLAHVDQVEAGYVARGQALTTLAQWRAHRDAIIAKRDAAIRHIADVEKRQAEQAALDKAYEERRRQWEADQASGAAAVLAETTDKLAKDAEALTAKYNDLQRRFDQGQGIQKARNEEAVAKQDEAKWDGVYTALTDAITVVLRRAKDVFVEDVRKHMPEADKMPNGGVFDISLNEGARETCDIGLRRTFTDDAGESYETVITALSGAEEVMTITAMAAALGERKGPEYLTLVTLRERGIHPNRLGDAMRALSKAPVQIIWTNTVKPKGGKPGGWKIIDLDAYEPPEETFEQAAGLTASGVDRAERRAEIEEAAREEAEEEAAADGLKGAKKRKAIADAVKTAVEAFESEADVTPDGGHAAKLGIPSDAVLPDWMQAIVDNPGPADGPGKCLTTLGAPSSAVNAVVTTVMARFPSASSGVFQWWAQTEPGADGVPQVVIGTPLYYRFSCGLVGRWHDGRVRVYQGDCKDPNVVGALPVWASPPLVGKFLFVVDTDVERAVETAFAAAFGREDGAGVVASAKVPGGEWRLTHCGAVIYTTNGKRLSVYSGTTGADAKVALAVNEKLGRLTAGVDSAHGAQGV